MYIQRRSLTDGQESDCMPSTHVPISDLLSSSATNKVFRCIIGLPKTDVLRRLHFREPPTATQPHHLRRPLYGVCCSGLVLPPCCTLPRPLWRDRVNVGTLLTWRARTNKLSPNLTRTEGVPTSVNQQHPQPMQASLRTNLSKRMGVFPSRLQASEVCSPLLYA